MTPPNPTLEAEVVAMTEQIKPWKDRLFAARAGFRDVNEEGLRLAGIPYMLQEIADLRAAVEAALAKAAPQAAQQDAIPGDLDALVREYGNAPCIGSPRTRRVVMQDIYRLAGEIFGTGPASLPDVAMPELLVNAQVLVDDLRTHHETESWNWDDLLTAASMIEKLIAAQPAEGAEGSAQVAQIPKCEHCGLPLPDPIGRSMHDCCDATTPAAVVRAPTDLLYEHHKSTTVVCSSCNLTLGQSWLLHDIKRGAVEVIAAEGATQAGLDEKPRAWMRRWAFDGEVPHKIKNANHRMVWAPKFRLLPLTEKQCAKDDVPLFARIDGTTQGEQGDK